MQGRPVQWFAASCRQACLAFRSHRRYNRPIIFRRPTHDSNADDANGTDATRQFLRIEDRQTFIFKPRKPKLSNMEPPPNKNPRRTFRIVLISLAVFLIVAPLLFFGAVLHLRAIKRADIQEMQSRAEMQLLRSQFGIPLEASETDFHFTPSHSQIRMSTGTDMVISLFLLFLLFGGGIALVAGIIYLIVSAARKSGSTSAKPIAYSTTATVKFCSNCGGDVQEGAYACPKCGFAIRSKRHYCFHCGVKTDPEQVMCVQCGVALVSPASSGLELFGGTKQKLPAGLFAILLGSFGVHKFYLESWGWGLIYLLFCWSALPGIIGIFEGIVLLTMDDQAFDMRYNQTPPSPFRW